MKNEFDKSVKTSVEISVRLILLFFLVAWCLYLLLPFIEPVLWGVIIAVSLSPTYHKINNAIGNKPKLTSVLLILSFFAALIIPASIAVFAMTDKVNLLIDLMNNGELRIPPPDQRVADWPIIGEKLYSIWLLFSSNLEDALNNYEGQIAQVGKSILTAILSMSTTIAMFLFSIVIAGVLLATKGTSELNQKVFTRIIGSNGSEFAKLSENTIRSVTKGVIGVAFIQAILLGTLFTLAGVPYAGVWGTLCLILAVMQLPPTLISIPVVVYIFSESNDFLSTVWIVLIILSGFVDNILKPILMGKGSTVPMLVIFLGSLGGFMTTGFLGLFTGAIVLSIGYQLFIAWINSNNSKTQKV